MYYIYSPIKTMSFRIELEKEINKHLRKGQLIAEGDKRAISKMPINISFGTGKSWILPTG